MLNSRRIKDRLQHLLQTAHASKADLPIPDGWQSVTMDRIRSVKMADENLRTTFLFQFEELVWRLAPVTGVLLAIIGVALHGVHFISGGDLLQLVAHENDSLDLWWL